jgi:hypothetical protein
MRARVESSKDAAMDIQTPRTQGHTKRFSWWVLYSIPPIYMQNLVAIQAIIAVAVEMIGVDHYAARLEVTIPALQTVHR